ncbi:MAG: DNA polymerase III subunit delta' [Lachnospiraceae bacterium]|nr:DNA polymerase III subunit delta' [Lachnospiraceae bacterium]
MPQFEDILGNSQIKNNIKTAIANKSVNHAYIICGPEGSGKRLIADVFAKALQCEGDRSLCGVCQSCRMTENGNNPDILYPVPLKTKVIGVDDIRDQVVKPSSIKPYMFKYKVFIIEDADKMTVQAQNAFLKTLEEPSTFSVFLLLAETLDAFLPTVLSRCVVLRTEPVDTKSIYSLLLSEGIDENTASLSAEYARGSVGEALSLARDEEFIAMREDVINILSGIYDKNTVEVMMLGNYFKNTYKENKRLIDVFYLWFRDLLAAKTTDDEKYIIQKDKKELIFKSAEKETVEGLVKKTEAVKKTAFNIKRNASFQTAMEVMLMNIKES